MQVSKLKWKCRKGVRELDILLTRYLDNIFVTSPIIEQDIFKEFIEKDTYEILDILMDKKDLIKNIAKLYLSKNIKQMTKSSVLLGVNIDHVAFIKKSRETSYPNLIQAVKICEKSGADSITIHLREDRRHIQDNDAKIIRQH